jgi:hypothetical protein
MHAALGGAGAAALGGAHGLRGLLGRGKAPWEQLDEKATSPDPHQILGPAQDGFDPVAAGDDGTSGTDTGDLTGGGPAHADSAGGNAVPALRRPDPAPEGLDPVERVSGHRARPQGQPRSGDGRAPRTPTGAQPTLDFGDDLPGSTSSEVPQVAPITGGPDGSSWDRGAPPISSYVDHTADVPLPLDAPPDEGRPAPPPSDSGTSAATVDPITGD